MTVDPDSREGLKKTERRFVDRVWNNEKYHLLPDLHTEDYVGHWFNPDGGDVDLDGLEAFIRTAHEGFSDFTMEIEFIHVDGDTTTVGFTATGTHDGEYIGIPATGNRGDTHGIWVHRFEDGQIAEGWASWDALGQLQELGIVPEDFTLAAFLETGANMAAQGILKRTRSD